MMKFLMKNILPILAALFFVVSCTEKDKDPVKAIVNGVEIKTSQAGDPQALEQKIEETVVQTEAKRIHISEKELLEFFDILKTRNIPKDQLDKFVKDEFKDKELKPKSKDEIVDLLREKQYEQAKKRYISELKDRSTIWILVDGQKTHYQSPAK